MSPRNRIFRPLIAVATFALIVPIALAGCGKEDSFVDEGEPIELGKLLINVQITRFLNPDDVEDREYLAGQAPPPVGQDYLAVFMKIENEGDADLNLPRGTDLTVVDTTGVEYAPLPSDSLFALPLGTVVPGGSEVPAPETAARSGPIKGAMVLFLVNESASENRPLELEIFAAGRRGTVELDI